MSDSITPPVTSSPRPLTSFVDNVYDRSPLLPPTAPGAATSPWWIFRHFPVGANFWSSPFHHRHHHHHPISPGSPFHPSSSATGGFDVVAFADVLSRLQASLSSSRDVRSAAVTTESAAVDARDQLSPDCRLKEKIHQRET